MDGSSRAANKLQSRGGGPEGPHAEERFTNVEVIHLVRDSANNAQVNGCPKFKNKKKETFPST